MLSWAAALGTHFGVKEVYKKLQLPEGDTTAASAASAVELPCYAFKLYYF